MARPIERVVARVAPRQHGLITRGQLIEADIPERTIDNYLAAERLDRLHASVYGVPGTPDSWLRRVCAATLSTGGVAAGRSSAGLHDLLPAGNLPIEVVVPVTANPSRNGFVLHRTTRPFSVEIVHGIATTSVLRTIEDISRTLPRRVLDEVVDRALFRRLLTLDELGTARAPVARLAVERSGSPVESPLETNFLQIVRANGLPTPVAQFEIRRGGVVVARADFAYPRERIVIELESYEFHSGRRPFDRGYQRLRAVQEAGYLLVPFTATDLRRPKAVATTVRRALFERGHPDIVQL